jgi:hypothetical protein
MRRFGIAAGFLGGLLLAWQAHAYAPITRTTSDASGGTKNSTPWEPDVQGDHFDIECANVVTGTVTYTVQYSYDDVNALGVAGVTWWNHPATMSATGNTEAGFDRPVRWIRLQQTAGNGSVIMTCIQTGPR